MNRLLSIVKVRSGAGAGPGLGPCGLFGLNTASTTRAPMPSTRRRRCVVFIAPMLAPTRPKQLHKQYPQGHACTDVSANQRDSLPTFRTSTVGGLLDRVFPQSVTAQCDCRACLSKSTRPAAIVRLQRRCSRAGSVACACATTCRGITGLVPGMLSRRAFVDTQWRTRARRLCWPQLGTTTQSASGRRQAASATARFNMQTRRRAGAGGSSWPSGSRCKAELLFAHNTCSGSGEGVPQQRGCLLRHPQWSEPSGTAGQ